MGFKVFNFKSSGDRKTYYYIIIENSYPHTSDEDISDILDLTLEDYKKLMLSFKAIRKMKTFVFENENDAQKCADYLNDKYLVILTLADVI